ncbi:hypothetical protein GGR50DRAFT_343144 [Xylaria sp. CBS 124048]|nr:hypothetical protein GGR50DRAFT_343144 [Xylaria sp. CBS 124048]
MNTAVNRARAIRPFIGFPGSPGTASFSTEIMLGRARDRAKLAPPPANTSASKPDLAKQLFPSSSPQQEYDIASWANSKRPHSTAMASARLNKPLMPGAGNSRPSGVRNSPTTSTAAATRINSLVSVCSNAGSFEDRPLCAGQSRSYGTSSSVLVNEDDISDDDTNLLAELNYERPASLLPSMSTSSSNQPSEFQPPSSVPDFAAAGAPPTTSDIPWSSSPQHHMFPPETTDQTMRKRGSPDESAQLVKKRILPESWNRPSKEDADKSNSTGLAFDTPFASGSQLHSNKTESLWDATQSAVNEKRKKLKNQSKTAQANLPPDEEGTVTDDHATKKAISLSSETAPL